MFKCPGLATCVSVIWAFCASYHQQMTQDEEQNKTKTLPGGQNCHQNTRVSAGGKEPSRLILTRTGPFGVIKEALSCLSEHWELQVNFAVPWHVSSWGSSVKKLQPWSLA